LQNGDCASVQSIIIMRTRIIPATSKRVPSSNTILLTCEKIRLVYHTYLSLETAVKSISPSVKPRVRFQNRINRYEYYCIIYIRDLNEKPEIERLYIYIAGMPRPLYTLSKFIICYQLPTAVALITREQEVRSFGRFLWYCLYNIYAVNGYNTRILGGNTYTIQVNFTGNNNIIQFKIRYYILGADYCYLFAWP